MPLKGDFSDELSKDDIIAWLHAEYESIKNDEMVLVLNPVKAIAVKRLCAELKRMLDNCDSGKADYTIEFIENASVVTRQVTAIVKVVTNTFDVAWDNVKAFQNSLDGIDQFCVNIYNGDISMVFYIGNLFVELDESEDS